MNSFRTNNLKFSLSTLSIFVFVAILAFGCQKEIIQPENSAQTLQGAGIDQIVRPDVQCGSSVFGTLQDGATPLGSTEMLNSDDTFYMLFTMEPDQFIDDLKIYIGDINGIPTDSDANILLEGFNYQYLLSNAATEYTFTIPTTDMHVCTDIVVWMRVSTRDMFGTVIETHDAWMTGTPYSNGFSTGYCLSACAVGQGGGAATL